MAEPFHVAVSAIDRGEIEKKLANVANGAKKAMVSAINDTLVHARANITRLIAEQTYLRKKDIRNDVRIAQKATSDVREGIIKIKYVAEPLIGFKIRFSKKSGVTVATIKDGAIAKFKHQFKAKMDSGHVGAFYRDLAQPKQKTARGSYAGRIIKRGPRKGQPILRQPIKQAYGPAVTTILAKNPDIPHAAMTDINDYLKKRIESKVKFLLGQSSQNV